MKTTILSILIATIIPTVSFAKIEDFNAMITENSKSQEVLHNELKEQMAETRQAQAKSPKTYEVAKEESSVNSPTTKSFLTFQKETVEYRGSEVKKQERLAHEIKVHDAF